jgi:hypothetical protein
MYLTIWAIEYMINKSQQLSWEGNVLAGFKGSDISKEVTQLILLIQPQGNC